MQKIIQSKYLLPITSDPILNGSIVADDNLVIAIGEHSKIKRQYPALPVEDYSDSIILPGFINCHSHLELTPLRDKITDFNSFTDWIKQIIPLKMKLNSDDYIHGVKEGIWQLRETGVVAVGDISSEYLSYDVLKESPMKGRVYFEFLALRPGEIENRFHRLNKHLPQQPEFPIGLSPHSPYTLCEKAFDDITREIRRTKHPYAIHVAESQEEADLFHSRSGELFRFIHGYVPFPEKISNTSPLTYLYDRGYLNENGIIIHLNIFLDKDIDILKKLNLSVIHCPLSHDYFMHPVFRLKELMDNGINVALGTDSLASNHTLNFFEELRRLKKNFPHLTPETIIKMATINGAKALKLNKGFGEIKIGSVFHCIAVPAEESIHDPYEAVIYFDGALKHLSDT